MENLITLEEVVKEIELTESGESFKLIDSEGDEHEVGYADCWIGGEGCEGWMCQTLGNVYYPDAEELAEAIFDYINGELNLGLEEIDY